MKRVAEYFALIILLVACKPSGNPGPSPTPTPTPAPSATPVPSPSPTPTLTPNSGLPAPNHALLFGYYFADGKYGDFRSEVNCYTNLYLAVARDGYQYDSEEMPVVWLPRMNSRVQSAFNDGKRIYLNLSQDGSDARSVPLDEVLDMMKPYWSAVDIIEMADEPSWTKQQTNAKIQDLRAKLTQKGMRIPPIGNVYTKSQTLDQDAILASELDWVGLEAYVNPPGSNTSQVNIDKLNQYLDQAKARVPKSKSLVIVMQAYSRNFGWTNMETLKDLQVPTYLQAYNDTRVLALTMFSYGRPSGTRENAMLRLIHRRIGNAIQGASCKPGG